MKPTNPPAQAGVRRALTFCAAMSLFATLNAPLATFAQIRKGFSIFKVVDAIPNEKSAEANKDAEPSIAVRPPPYQSGQKAPMLLSAFKGNSGSHHYFTSTNGGTIWSNNLPDIAHGDTTVEWSSSGQAYLTRLFGVPNDLSQGSIDVQSSPNPQGSAAFVQVPGSLYTTSAGNFHIPDQPWLELANVNGVERIYVAFNDLAKAPKSASIHFSLDGGTTWNNSPAQPSLPPVVIEKVLPTLGQDSPAVRVAAARDGATVYALFLRWKDFGPMNADTKGDIVVVRDDNGGLNGFTNLGNGKIVVTNTFFPCSGCIEKPGAFGSSLGTERLGGNCSIAVDPNDPKNVYIAVTELVAASEFPPIFRVPGVRVYVSYDKGANWQNILADKIGIISALPALAVADNGALGVLYTEWDGFNLITHFLQWNAGLISAAVKSRILASFCDNDPPIAMNCGGPCHPYIGDYQDLEAIGNRFYGTFSASNEPDPSHFPSGVLFQRNVLVDGVITNHFKLKKTGTLANLAGGNVAVSIDPYFFADDAIGPPKLLTLGQYALNWQRLKSEPYSAPGLEASSALGPAARWTPVTEGIVETNDQFTFLIRPTEPNMFYRLVQTPPTNVQAEITAGAGPHGSVTPEGILFKDLGDSQEFTASAGPGYEIDAWHLDGAVAQVGGTNFTLRDIQDDHAVTVTFTLPDDLAVAKVGPLDPVAVSSNFFYRIFVKNTGTRDTTGVQMTDALPTGITGLSVQSSQGACTLSSNVVTCALGNLARGDSGMIEIQAVAVSEGSFTNVATVRGSAPETNLLNNTSAVVTVAGDSPRILRQPESQTVPARDPVSFTVGAEGTATLRYQWYFNGGYLAGETAATLSIPSAAAGNAGSYVVFVSNDFGIVESAPAILTVQ